MSWQSRPLHSSLARPPSNAMAFVLLSQWVAVLLPQVVGTSPTINTVAEGRNSNVYERSATMGCRRVDVNPKSKVEVLFATTSGCSDSRLSRKTTIAIVVMLVLIKVILAIVTPASLEVFAYLNLVTSQKDKTFANSPWAYLFNGTLGAWTSLPIAHPPLDSIWTSKSILIDPSLQLLVFMIKLPMLLSDLAVGGVIYVLGRKMFPSSRIATYAALLWLTNPYVTFVNEMMGAVDIIPVLTVMLGLYLLYGRRYLLSFLSVAVGVFVKLFPLFLIPAFVYSAKLEKVRSRKLFVYMLVGLAALAGYMWWGLLGERIGFLYAETPITQSITEFILARQTETFIFAYGGGDFLGVATFILVLVYLVVYEFRPRQFADPVKLSLLVLLAYLAFLDLQFQYVIWVAPLLTLVNLLDRRTVVPTGLVYVSSFLLGFVKDGFQTYEAYSLLFLNLQRPGNWLESWLSSAIQNPLLDIVATPFLRTVLSAFMILVAFLLVYSPRGKP